MNTPNTALAKSTLETVQSAKAGFLARLPKDIDGDRLFLGLVTLVQKRPDIAECDPKSIIIAGYEAAEIGINLNPALGLGYVVPYKGIAVFMLGYRGMQQMAYAGGAVKQIFAEVVHEADHFRRVLAPVRTLEHIPANGDRGKPIGAYAFVELRDNGIDFEYMTEEQIMRHRKHSKNPDSMMWTTFKEEGWRKTPIRVLFKRLPLTSVGMEKFVEIIGRDNEKEFEPFDQPPAAPVEIRRAVRIEPPNENTGPAAPVEVPSTASEAPNAGTRGRGKGKRPAEAAKAPVEAVAVVLCDAQDIEKAWRRLFSAGWAAYEVKDFLAGKGIADGKIANVPKDQLEGLLLAMESGTPK